ncbi:MAG: hypothetical protein ACOC1U_06690 [Spirochaetota bacterium]
MLRQRSRITVRQPDESSLAVQSNTGRRLLFGGIGVLLIVSFLVSADWSGEIADGMVAGTIFYFGITAICLAVAGWNSMVVLDGRDRSAHFIRRIFGITIGHSTLDLSAVRAVVIQGLRFLRESEQPQGGLGSSRLRNYMERRNAYYKLFLETDEKLHFVEDSTDVSDLEAAGHAMADFLGVSYRREEI